MLCADDAHHDFLGQCQPDAARRCDRGRLFLRKYWRVFGALQLGAQIIGFEIITVLAVPLPASASMEFSSTGGIAAGLLSADLPGIRQKPFAANPAWPLACACSWHRAPLIPVDLEAR